MGYMSEGVKRLTMLGKQSPRREPGAHWRFLPTAWHTRQAHRHAESTSEGGSASIRPRPEGLGGISPLSLGKWKFWSSSKPLVSAKMTDQRHRPDNSLLGVQGRWSGPPPLLPTTPRSPRASHFSQVASSEASGQSGVPSHSKKLSMQQPSLQWNSVE